RRPARRGRGVDGPAASRRPAGRAVRKPSTRRPARQRRRTERSPGANARSAPSSPDHERHADRGEQRRLDDGRRRAGAVRRDRRGARDPATTGLIVRWRQVIFLYAVVAVLGAEYWVFERRAPPAAETLPARPRLVPVAPGAVREVR